MGDKSSIEWTDASWNPVTGCSRVSPGCAHCYALELAPRLRAMGVQRYIDAADGGKGSGPAFGVTLHRDVLDQPLRWRRPRRIFVNSMSDLFHEDVPDVFIQMVWQVMEQAPEHVFQILTKRPERMREWVTGWLERKLDYAHRCETNPNEWMRDSPAAIDARARARPLPNVWLGVSIENRRFVGRADVLRETPAAVRFISAEPLLGPLVYDGSADDTAGEDRPWWQEDGYLCWSDDYEGPQLDLTGIDWLIVGGESGHRARPMDPQWARDLRDACQRDHNDIVGADRPHEQFPRWSSVGTAFFFKQWGGTRPKSGGRELDGRTWDEMPAVSS